MRRYKCLKTLFWVIIAIISIVLPLQTNASEAISEQNCAIFKDKLIVEAGICKRKQIINDIDAEYGAPGEVITSYDWQSGRVTRTKNVEEFFTIDGDDGETEFAKDGYFLCVKNLKSAEIFCVGDRLTKDSNSSSKTDINQSYPNWVIEAACLNRADFAQCKNNLLATNNNEEDDLQRPVMAHCEYAHPKKNWDFSEACFYTVRVNAVASIEFYTVQNGSNIRIETIAVNNGNAREGDIFFNGQKATVIQKNGIECAQIISTRETFCAREN